MQRLFLTLGDKKQNSGNACHSLVINTEVENFHILPTQPKILENAMKNYWDSIKK